LINSSRGIIYASKGTGYAEKAGKKQKMQQEMSAIAGLKFLSCWFKVSGLKLQSFWVLPTSCA
jgi:hypothetical protein